MDVVLPFTLLHVQIAWFMQYCYEQASSILNLFHIFKIISWYVIIPMLDEKSFQTFAIYCGLALHHAKVGKASCMSMGFELHVIIILQYIKVTAT